MSATMLTCGGGNAIYAALAHSNAEQLMLKIGNTNA